MKAKALLKKTAGGTIIALLLSPAVLAQDRQQQPPTRIQRLAGLGKVWARVKFTHPYLAYRQDIDWDDALIETLPKVEAAQSQEEYLKALDYMLGFLKDPETHILPSVSTQQAVTIENSSNGAKQSPPISGPAQPYVKWLDEDTAIIIANDYGSMGARTDLIEILKTTFKEAAKANSILLDLRSLRGSAGYGLPIAFEQALPSILTKDVELTPIRFVHSFGYPPQSEGTPSNYGYYAELVTRASGVIRSDSREPNRTRHLSFLLNAQSFNLSDILLALQESGQAYVIEEGAGPEPDYSQTSNAVDIADGVRLQLRHAELLTRSGASYFSPDQTIALDSSNPDKARQAALQSFQHWKSSELAARACPSPVPASSASLVSFTDKPYHEMTYPDSSHRMLALFRLWGVINYFFAYKDLMDQPWDKTLEEFIPKMEAALDATSYVLTVAEMTTRIQDSHGLIISDTLDNYFGTHRPPARVHSVEGQSVITDIEDSIQNKTDLHVGDIVLAVDGEDVVQRRERLAKYLPASTPGRLRDKIHLYLLNGAKNSEAVLRVQDQRGQIKETKLARTALALGRNTRIRSLPVFGKLPSGYGYIDMDRLTATDAAPALEAVKDTPGLILDMRGYPLGGSFQLASLLAHERKVAAQFEFPEWDGAYGSFSTRHDEQYVEPVGGPKYDRKIVVLIYEGSQSAAEHTCLQLEAATHVTFIGSSTSGANGTVSFTYLPGGVTVRFTGLDVRHGDGRQLQRVGIQPDIKIEPTIQGIREGRDEVLERAVTYLQSGK